MYHCPAHKTYRTLQGWTFHSSWCNQAWDVVEQQVVRVEAARSAKPARPPWAIGKSTRAVVALARANGLNPYDRHSGHDIWDGFDPVVRKEFMAR